MVKVTGHAKERMKERCGVNKKASQRLADLAYEKGLTHAECSGRLKLKKYITTLYFKNKQANRVRIYGEKVYIFNEQLLITVLPLPNDLKKIANIQENKKREGTL